MNVTKSSLFLVTVEILKTGEIKVKVSRDTKFNANQSFQNRQDQSQTHWVPTRYYPAWLLDSLTDTSCWGGTWSVISDRQPLVSHTIKRARTKPRQMAREEKTARNGERVGRRAKTLPPRTVFISHHQREACNERDSDSVPCNLLVAGSRLDSSITYLISNVVWLAGMIEFFI